VLECVVEVLSSGDSITVVPTGRELAAQQAADLVGTSRTARDTANMEREYVLHTRAFGPA
jgi:hypothetical protein